MNDKLIDSHDQTPIKRALLFIEQGWSPVPIPSKEKGPKLKGWQNLRITAETAKQYFSEQDQNVGVILGEASGGLIDIDLDCCEALRLVYLLPPTGLGFGRASTPLSHVLYYCPDICKTTKYLDPIAAKDEAMLLEIRASGQTVFPGSIHPSGEKIYWKFGEDWRPAVVSGDVLVAAVNRLAACALLGRYWPKGSRHDAALALAGSLVTNGHK